MCTFTKRILILASMGLALLHDQQLVTDPTLIHGQEESVIPAKWDKEKRFGVLERKFEGECWHQLRNVMFHSNIHSFGPSQFAFWLLLCSIFWFMTLHFLLSFQTRDLDQRCDSPTYWPSGDNWVFLSSSNQEQFLNPSLPSYHHYTGKVRGQILLHIIYIYICICSCTEDISQLSCWLPRAPALGILSQIQDVLLWQQAAALLHDVTFPVSMYGKNKRFYFQTVW